MFEDSHQHRSQFITNDLLMVLQTKYQNPNLTRSSLDAFCPFGLICRACPVIIKKYASFVAAILRKALTRISSKLAFKTDIDTQHHKYLLACFFL